MLNQRYDAAEVEPRILRRWQEQGIYKFEHDSPKPVYSIDTPPPTVSGNLHLGHIYSYSHADFIARFYRMNGYNVFYPMGYDDNGLPTERLVEKRLGINAKQVGRRTFIEQCLQVSEAVEQEYRNLWTRTGLSIDWRYTYRTIDTRSRRISQLSFLSLYRQGLAYRNNAPAIWCPECKTSIAQAELSDALRNSEFVDVKFSLESGQSILISTTRPELLPACVAIFVHPGDVRYSSLIGQIAQIPLFGQRVPILADLAADPSKGTGVVMCCTFGDTTDVAWWRSHQLPLMRAIDENGRMSSSTGFLAGKSIVEARRAVIAQLESESLIANHHPTEQSVRVHERCDTPVEYLVVSQWFYNLLQFKQEFLELGEKVRWLPEHMQARYRAWVENLNWDWCISRQRYFGVPFPVWYCKSCGEELLATEECLPVDPLEDQPSHPCEKCGSREFIPEADVFDTWATSSMSPQIVGGWLDEAKPWLYSKVFPFSLRPQAHEIIRTWAFYTMVKSSFHFNSLPWKDVLISGWGLAAEGMGKISKSRGGGPMPPLEMIEKYSADTVRYWAASTGPGRDAIISEEKIQAGSRLVTKLWNIARFSDRFLQGYIPKAIPENLSPADRWILTGLNSLIIRTTDYFYAYEYSNAKSDAEQFFWTDLADNYIEMSKQRLYAQQGSEFEAAQYTLYYIYLSIIKLFAPFLPFVTDQIYLDLFARTEGYPSVHISPWPTPVPAWHDSNAEQVGSLLVEVATAVRRYKSEKNLSLGMDLLTVKLALKNTNTATEQDRRMFASLLGAVKDLSSVTRATHIEFYARLPEGVLDINPSGRLAIAIDMLPEKDSE